MSDENTSESIRFTPRGYITVNEALDRLYFSYTMYTNAFKEEYGREHATKDLRKSLYAGDVPAMVIKSDGSLQELPNQFWGAEEARDIIKANGHVKDYLEYWAPHEYSGWIIISEKNFSSKLEMLVIPAPDREMPAGLLFLSSSEIEGTKSTATYMDIDDALQSVSDQRRAYVQDTQEENWSKARDYLRSMLYIGRIRAFHKDKSGYMRLLRPSDWSADGAIMSRIFKKNHVRYEPLDFEGDRYRTIPVQNVWISSMNIHVENRPVEGSVIVLNAELMQILQNFPSTDSQQRFMSVNSASAADINTNRGGRPPDHDREVFLIEAFKIIYLGPEPKTQAELIEKTVKSYQDEREKVGISKPPPGETWMKECTRSLWRWIAEGRKGR